MARRWYPDEKPNSLYQFTKKDIEEKRRVGSNQIIKVEIKKLITDLNNAPAGWQCLRKSCQVVNTIVDENVKIKSILTARLSAIFLASASDSDCPKKSEPK